MPGTGTSLPSQASARITPKSRVVALLKKNFAPPTAPFAIFAPLTAPSAILLFVTAPLAILDSLTAPFLMFFVLTLLGFSLMAAKLAPPRATNSARQATNIAGLGLSLLPILNMLLSLLMDP